jgi:hypothetical protein
MFLKGDRRLSESADSGNEITVGGTASARYVFREVFDLKSANGMARDELARLLDQGAAASNCRLTSKSAVASRRIRRSAGPSRTAVETAAPWKPVRARRMNIANHPKTRHICSAFDLYKTVSAKGAAIIRSLGQRPRK